MSVKNKNHFQEKKNSFLVNLEKDYSKLKLKRELINLDLINIKRELENNTELHQKSEINIKDFYFFKAMVISSKLKDKEDFLEDFDELYSSSSNVIEILKIVSELIEEIKVKINNIDSNDISVNFSNLESRFNSFSQNLQDAEREESLLEDLNTFKLLFKEVEESILLIKEDLLKVKVFFSLKEDFKNNYNFDFDSDVSKYVLLKVEDNIIFYSELVDELYILERDNFLNDYSKYLNMHKEVEEEIAPTYKKLDDSIKELEVSNELPSFLSQLENLKDEIYEGTYFPSLKNMERLEQLHTLHKELELDLEVLERKTKITVIQYVENLENYLVKVEKVKKGYLEFEEYLEADKKHFLKWEEGSISIKKVLK